MAPPVCNQQNGKLYRYKASRHSKMGLTSKSITLFKDNLQSDEQGGYSVSTKAVTFLRNSRRRVDKEELLESNANHLILFFKDFKSSKVNIGYLSKHLVSRQI